MVKKKTPKRRRFNPRQLWGDLNANTWLSILSQLNPDTQWEEYNESIRGCCPVHSESNPSFYISPNKRFAKCYGCDYYEDDPINIIKTISKRQYAESLAFVVSELGDSLTTLPPNAAEEAKQYGKTLALKKILAKVCNQELVNTVNDRLEVEANSDYAGNPDFDYGQTAVAYLEQRGIPLTEVHALRVGVMPPRHRLFKVIRAWEEQTGTTEAWNELEKEISEVLEGREGWLVFPYCHSPSEISCFRLREPIQKNSKGIITFFKDEDSPVGFYGLDTPALLPLLGGRSRGAKPEVVAVEGEFDAMSLVLPQVLTGDASTIVVGFGGKACYSLDPLMSLGIDSLKIISDWDGTAAEVLKGVLAQTTKLNYSIYNPPLDMPEFLGTKDIHDVYKRFFEDPENLQVESTLHHFLDVFTEDENYIKPVAWFEKVVLEALEPIPSDDIRAVLSVISRHATLLQNGAERIEGLRRVEEAIGISLEEVVKDARGGSTEAFADSIEQILSDIYTLMYEVGSGGSFGVAAWNKKKQCERIFSLSSERETIGQLRADLGATRQWVETRCGMPNHLKEQVDSNGKVTKELPETLRTRYYETLIATEIVPNMCQKQQLLMREDYITKSAGVHVPTDSEVYVVNGKRVYKGTQQDFGDYDWKLLDAPVDNGMIFNYSVRPWTAEILSPEDLATKTSASSIGEAYRMACDVIDTAFRFTDHELDTQYLAAFAILLPLTDVFFELPWIQFRGPTNTGKSAISQLLGAKRLSHRITEHVTSFDTWTSAGMQAVMNSSTLGLMIDEFESEKTGTKKSMDAINALETLRNAMGAGAEVVLGSRRGIPIYRTLRFPIASSAISVFEKVQDRNRVNRIEMATEAPGLKEIKASTASALVLGKFGEERIAELRRNILFSGLANIDQIREAYLNLREDFFKDDPMHEKTPPRFRSQLYPILATLKVAGEDHRVFARDYSIAKTEELLKSANTADYQELLTSIMFTPCIKHSDLSETSLKTVSQLINEPGQTEILNDSNTGVFYLSDAELLVFFWPLIERSGILRRSRFSRITQEGLRTIMSEDTRVVKDVDMFINPIKRTLKSRVNPNEICVIPAIHFLGEFSQPLKTVDSRSDVEERFAMK